MPILGSCCCCFDLKVGSKIIGILNLIGALINSISFGLLLFMLGLARAGTKATFDAQPLFPEDDDYQDLNESKQEMMDVVMSHQDAVMVALYILLGLSLLCVITSSMLIHGVRRNRRGLLVPFLIQETITILCLVAIAIAGLAILGTHHIVVSTALSVVGGSLIHVYFLLVIVSQYQALGLIRMHEEISMK